MYAVSLYPEFQEDIFVHSGPDSMDVFFKRLMYEHRRIKSILGKNVKMAPFSDAEKQTVKDAVVCPICKNAFTDKNRLVLHHAHSTGRCIAPICNSCNLQIKPRKRRRPRAPKIHINNDSEDDELLPPLCDEDGYVDAVPNSDLDLSSESIDSVIPVYMHNMTGYDCHFIIKNFQKRVAIQLTSD